MSEPEKPSKRNPTKADDWQEFYEELQQEGPRGGVLLGAAFLDEHLRQLLQAFFVDHSASRELLQGYSLNSFSTRINLAFSLGLIPRDMHKDLCRIRDIRNEFAHALQGLTLEDEWVIERTNKLKWPRLLGEYSDIFDQAGPGDKLLISIAMIANNIKLAALSAARERRTIPKNKGIGQYKKAGDGGESQQ